MQRRIEEGIARLRGLREGDLAVPDLITCGQAAVGPLRAFLFARDPSGIFQPRCQAVEILAALGAREVLVDFLAHPPQFADPVEQAGVDVVTSAVASALVQWPDDDLFPLLLQAVDRKLLPGVVDALGQFARKEAVPVLSAALGEDFCRAAAESGFRRLGTEACPHLLRLAKSRMPSSDAESEMSRRRRRSALRLWGEMCQGGALPETVWSLMEDADDRVTFLACSVCLPHVSPAEVEKVAVRLVTLLDSSDWLLRTDVEDLLVKNYAACRPVVERSLTEASERAAMALRYVIRKASASNE